MRLSAELRSAIFFAVAVLAVVAITAHYFPPGEWPSPEELYKAYRR